MIIARINNENLEAHCDKCGADCDCSLVHESNERKYSCCCPLCGEKLVVLTQFVNEYACPDDDMEWTDRWSCACNDKCPECNKEITPMSSVEEIVGFD